MDTGQVWRDVIHAYVRAFCDDQRKRFADNVGGWEARFLAAHAVDSLRQDYILAAKAQLDRFGEPGPKEDIQIVEQSEQRIVAEVPAHRSSKDALSAVPFMPTRFVLTKAQPGWLIDSMFQPCISCNLPSVRLDLPAIPRTPGKCFLCRGKRELARGFKSRAFWIFKRDQPVHVPCSACNGKGTCPECSGAIMPGWIRMVSIGYLRPVTGSAESPSS